jgi:hypothetical protein
MTSIVIDPPNTAFSDPADEISSEGESFDEDDMYGIDSAMEAISNSSGNEEEIESFGVTGLEEVMSMQIIAHIYCVNIL